MSSFVHLHVHSHYSLLEASCRPKEIAKFASENQMDAIALTDNGNMFGAIEFYFACRSLNVKPIIGLDVYLAPLGHLNKDAGSNSKTSNSRLVLLAQNQIGYQNLCKLSTISYQQGFYYKPRIDFDLLSKHSEGLIVLNGGHNSDISRAFLNGDIEKVKTTIDSYKTVFNDNFYFEICKQQTKGEEELNLFYKEQSKAFGVPLVASNNAFYLNKSDKLAQEVLICIGTNKTLHDDSRFTLGSNEFYLKKSSEIEKLFKDCPEAISNTQVISNKIDLEFELSDSEGKPIYHLPSFPTQEGRTLSEEVRTLSLEGLEDRVNESSDLKSSYEGDLKKEYLDRLDYELATITSMGFNGYFLVVQDFINWAKKNDIPVGPGRGSGAGSLVAYCLKITDVNPMLYNLIFERFLNPERVSMPDFDIDFCQEKRVKVIEYVTEKYGRDSVAQIITHGKLQARAAIRDTGRVLGMTYAEVDAVAKLIPDKLGINLKEALELEPKLNQLMDVDPKVSTLMDLAQKVEGLVRHAGIHAAGVIIADGSLVDYAPLYRGVEGENVVQYDMKHSEKIGLIKFDFLGLKTLTVIKDCVRLIKNSHKIDVNISDISLGDPGVYEIFCQGDTLGVFQFEGEGITDFTKKIKPNCFEDIIAINALYRPGPMDMIPEYTARKQGSKKVIYLFEELEPILKETYGVIVYQEQVQLIASTIASYSLGEADILRRAMGKKIAEEMDRQKVRFIDGAIKNGHDKKKAEELFDLMAEFAKYGFNKSHATAYCYIAAQTAWLKHYYRVEFYAALLSSEMNDTNKLVKYVKQARLSGVVVEPPHINSSDFKFSVQNQKIYFSLGAIKGVGQSAVEAILFARSQQEGKKFDSLEDFFGSIDLRRVNKKVIECLVKSGGLDGFGFHRAQLFEQYHKYLENADRKNKENEVGQENLFAFSDETSKELKIDLTEVSKWARKARLANEKDVLGFYLSDHPLNGVEKISKLWANKNIEELNSLSVVKKQKISLVSMVSRMKEFITKKGTRMAFTVLEDLTGQIEAIFFPDTYALYQEILKEDVPLIVVGEFERKDDSSKILVESVSRLSDKMKTIKSIIISVNKIEDDLAKVNPILKDFSGDTPIYFDYSFNENSKNIRLKSKSPKGIEFNEILIDRFQIEFGSTDFLDFKK